MDGNGGFSARRARLAVVIALLSFVAFVAVPSRAEVALLVVLLLAALAVLVCSLGWMRSGSGPRTVAAVAAASAVGLVGSVLRLRSLADEPSAIPLAGVSVLLLSLVGLIVSAVLLRDRPDLALNQGDRPVAGTGPRPPLDR